ncbi:MAG: UvrD-helicase domain-containing protein [Nannocystaceae bacterium]
MSLNAEQQRAVAHRGGPLLVLAGAGTGKTRVITHRVAALIEEGVAPWRVLAVTFTNKAASEMRERIGDLGRARGIDTEGLWVGTFHSTCARILRRHGEAVGLSRNFTIYDAADQKTLMGRVLKDLDFATSMFPPGQILGCIDRAKNAGWGPKDVARLDLDEPVRTVVERAFSSYQERLRATDAVDFGDLLGLTVELLRGEKDGAGRPSLADTARMLAGRFTHVVVDEYQDTNLVQAELVDRLASHAELCVVGDDDQAIYGWRGADVKQILEFPDRHTDCELVRLEQNYRSTGHILACADGVITPNRSRHGKTLWTELESGDPVRVCKFDDQRDEAHFVTAEIAQGLAEGVDPEEIVVFFRTNAQSRPFEEVLRERGIAYRVLGGMRFFDRQEIKDLVAYLRLIDTPSSNLDLERVINRPARGIGAKSVDRLRAHAATRDISLYDALSQVQETDLGAAARKRVTEFAAMLHEVRTVADGMALPEVAQMVLEKSGYWEGLGPDSDIEASTRRENLQEFVNGLAEFGAAEPNAVLGEYLDQIALASQEDENQDRATVTIMTVHAGKGLEFDRVYVTGLEEGVFPHLRALDDPIGMAEERRLAYVAVTRAKRSLTITYVERRWMFGKEQVNRPSRFLRDLPLDSIQRVGDRPRRRVPVTRAATKREPVESAWNADIELDAGVGAPGGDGVCFYAGMAMRHPKFGVGDLLSWNGTGDNLKVVVAFAGHGRKTILARFCQPA